jgi:polyisoprenoid-binding protein YceI
MRRSSLALALMLAAAPSLAETRALAIDPEHTAVVFSWSHMGYSNPIARLEQVAGAITVDEADPSRSTVSVTMSLDGLRTGSAALDHRLKGAEFFDQAHFPEITFTSTRLEKTSKETFKLYGTLTAHGVAKAVVLAARVNKYTPNLPLITEIGGFEADTTLRRSDFDMGKFVPAVSDELKVHITLEAVPAS